MISFKKHFEMAEQLLPYANYKLKTLDDAEKTYDYLKEKNCLKDYILNNQLTKFLFKQEISQETFEKALQNNDDSNKFIKTLDIIIKTYNDKYEIDYEKDLSMDNLVNLIIDYKSVPKIHEFKEMSYASREITLRNILYLIKRGFTPGELIDISKQMNVLNYQDTIDVLNDFNNEEIIKICQRTNGEHYTHKKEIFIYKCLADDDIYNFVGNGSLLMQNLNVKDDIDTKKLLMQFIEHCKYNNVSHKQILPYVYVITESDLNKHLYNRVIDHIKQGFAFDAQNQGIYDIYKDLGYVTTTIEPDVFEFLPASELLLNILLPLGIKVDRIIEYLNSISNVDKAVLNSPLKIFSEHLEHFKDEDNVTFDKDSQVYIDILKNKANVNLSAYNYLKNCMETLNIKNIKLSQLIRLSNLAEYKITKLSKITDESLTIDDKLSALELISYKVNNLQTAIKFVKKCKFNNNIIKSHVKTKNSELTPKDIIKVIASDLPQEKINYLLTIQKQKHFNLLLGLDFDINKSVDENVKDVIKHTNVYEQFIENSNNQYTNISDTKLISLYMDDYLDIYNKYKANHNISTKQHVLFDSIFKAVIENRFDEFKFKTLDFELDETVEQNLRNAWTKNTSKQVDKFTVFEDYSFDKTVKIGVLPNKTCMDYTDGMYSESLISNFDANKKIIFVKNDKGDIIARSIIKLTKIRDGQLRFNNDINKQFAILVERIYTTYHNVSTMDEIVANFVKEKFKDLNVLIIASGKMLKDASQSELSIFISFSRNHKQYSDTLAGEKRDDDMGRYMNKNVYIL